MLTASGATILDFGLEKLAIRNARIDDLLFAVPHPGSTAHRTEGFLGTFQYTACKQLDGEQTDVRTDWFARRAGLRDGYRR